MKTQFYISHSFNPYENLALEQYLFETVQNQTCILYLWQNEKTVVVGKNQNAWQECQVDYLTEQGGYVARRLSGGGAVYHDLGNLNFTFIMPTQQYDLQKQLAVILKAVQQLGIHAQASGRNDITVDGKKFSGNAFYHSGGKSYHHGTLLVDVDSEALSQYLKVSQDKLKSKGVSSVKSRVTNLINYVPDLTIDQLKQQLLEAFADVYEAQPFELSVADFDQQRLNQLNQQYASWQWRLGRAIPFTFQITTRFDWGGMDIQLQVNEGKIVDGHVYSDAMDSQTIERMMPLLIGQLFSLTTMAKIMALLKDGQNDQMLDDIAQWIIQSQQ